MTANYEIGLKIHIVQEAKHVHNLLDMHEIVQALTEYLSDIAAEHDAAVCVEFKEGKMDAK